MKYDYIIIGAGIAGCSVAHFLSQSQKNILLIDKNENFAQSASGAAGAFLSPLLGKPNRFKDLVTQSLKFSHAFYKQEFLPHIINKGVIRIPKNTLDAKKFQEYIPFIDFEYELKEGGCFFPIGTQVNSVAICENLAKNCEKKFNYDIKHIVKKDNYYLLNNEIKCKNLILTTGANTALIDENYVNIRAIWGHRIDIHTSTCIDVNYHKECSVSTSIQLQNSPLNKVSIGATHHRSNSTLEENCFDLENIDSIKMNDDNTIKADTELLLKRANDIVKLDDVEVVNVKFGARAASIDYFPMVGSLIDSKKTIDMFPYLTKGTHVPNQRLSRYENLYILNGLGGRGFVLAPFLAKNLVEFILNETPLSEDITVDRLFKKWVRKEKKD
ncbi:MAG: NAD(P)/FAD-dependent oxidoreductase [Candidatus Marinarcus sp.]|uniref:NAD(P)/FAD-dependent oxidoreductase n=1 Tax=Candidatus Marinarcus sp. TaxID=3100987 RepID=UPI003AFF79FB